MVSDLLTLKAFIITSTLHLQLVYLISIFKAINNAIQIESIQERNPEAVAKFLERYQNNKVKLGRIILKMKIIFMTVHVLWSSILSFVIVLLCVKFL